MNAWDHGFVDRCSPLNVTLATQSIQLPIVSRAAQGLSAWISVDARAARELLPPGSGLHLARITTSRALLFIAAIDHHDTTIGPCGEAAIGLLCTSTRLPPLLPLLAQRAIGGLGVYVLHQPVTTAVALEAGRSVWNYPRFLASVRFRHASQQRVCELTADGVRVLRFQVSGEGPVRREDRVVRMYSVRDDKLLRTDVAMQQEYHRARRRDSVRLELGDHPIARRLASLLPSHEMFDARSVRKLQCRVPAPSWVRPLEAM